MADFKDISADDFTDRLLPVSAVSSGFKRRNVFAEKGHFCTFSKVGIWNVYRHRWDIYGSCSLLSRVL